MLASKYFLHTHTHRIFLFVRFDFFGTSGKPVLVVVRSRAIKKTIDTPYKEEQNAYKEYIMNVWGYGMEYTKQKRLEHEHIYGWENYHLFSLFYST